ncbi:MAG: 30S ribosomal protein S5 [Patescibacteria group bacterium]|jgi:small subunit ribosomal protein S5
MPEDKKEKLTVDTNKGASQTVAQDLYGAAKKGQGGRDGGRNFRGGRRDERPKDDMEQRILEVARVTRVMAGGKRMNFRACVAIGDKKGNVGVGLGKGADVTMAVNKAVNHAKKEMVNVSTENETITHAIFHKSGAAKIMLKPAKKGRGVIAGGVTRIILELSGIKNVTSKTLGSNSKINNARCTIEALGLLKKRENKSAKAGEKEQKEGPAKEDKK